MKKVFFLLLLAIATTTTQAQKVRIDSTGNYAAIGAKTRADSPAINTGRTFTDYRGNTYPVFQSVKGKLFYFGKSKSGVIYKKYLKLED